MSLEASINIELETLVVSEVEKLARYLSANQLIVPSVDREQIAQLVKYIEFLEKWTKTIDLVSQESGKDMVVPHIIDSIAGFSLASPVEQFCCDVGSGAGLPGIVWALLKPNMQVILLEPRKRRVDFLKEVRRVLKLNNIEVINSRVEQIEPDGLFVNDSGSRMFVCRALGMEAAYLDFAKKQSGQASSRATILAGPSWSCPRELVDSNNEPNEIRDYSILADCPARKLISWTIA